MDDLFTEGAPFLSFSDLLTGYRLTSVLLLVHESGLWNAIGEQGASADEICTRMGWDREYGQRFLDCLCRLGLLRDQDGRYYFSPFAVDYLCPQSPRYQGQTLAFERQLVQSWHTLAATLKAGKRIFATEDKTPAELQQALHGYLGAMDEAAGIRADELWQALHGLPDRGTILDIGGGSGTFLRAFLDRFPAWSAIFCDLPHIVASEELHRHLSGVHQEIHWCGCNLLDDGPSPFDGISEQSCDLVLLSNIIHCQGSEETARLLRKVAAKTTPAGILVIHDFFTDGGWRGALYDLHMMLNTYNGRTYSLQECIDMTADYGFCHQVIRPLASGSTVLALARNTDMLQLL
jgi:hypothetical protein